MSQLLMEKNDLDHVPRIPVPEGYTLRTFGEGEEAGLSRVYTAASLGNETAEDVRKNILQHPCFKPERLFIIEHSGTLAGTAGAWREPHDPDVGYLHMVGLLPGHRGKRLGAILIVAAIDYTRNEGFDRQRLLTDDDREPALRLYAGLGYRPVYADESHPERWRTVAEKLARPELLARAIDRL